MSEEITLPRFGDAPLVFRGLQCGPTVRRPEDPETLRYFELRCYGIDSGGHAISASYRTRWKHEQDRDVAVVVPRGAVNAAELLRAVEPTLIDEDAIGFPRTSKAYEDKQRALIARLRGGFRVAIAELLTIDPNFYERLDE